MKVKLREFFSVENKDGEVIVGPAEIELSEAEVKLHAHKLEVIEEDKKKKKKTEE